MAEQSAAEIARKNCNTDWRSTRPTLIDRFKHVCLREDFSDVDFVFNKGLSGEMKIPTNTYMLIMASEVFEKLLLYDGNEKKRQEIVIKDEKLKADAIKIFLKFLYSDFKDVTGINDGSVWDVIYAAKMYMVMPLEKRCVNFLVKNLQPSNVFNLLDQCLKWEVSKELLDKCKQYIQKQTNEVLQSETFQGISFEHLIILLEQDTLSVTEGELLKSVLEWAKKACQSANLSPTPKNLRKKLGKAFSLIRFPAMSKEDFVNIVLPSKLFSVQEERDLVLMMAFDGAGANVAHTLPFSKTPRKRVVGTVGIGQKRKSAYSAYLSDCFGSAKLSNLAPAPGSQ